jgi:hypothetical protein
MTVTDSRPAMSHFPASNPSRQSVTGREDIRLYAGVSEHMWSGAPVTPGAYACISPISGRSVRTKRETCLTVPSGTAIIQDSGAFSDSWTQRLTFDQVLKRQVNHAERQGYQNQVIYLATYDLLIDEVWTDGNRSKRRWSVADAESAVDETVKAARWLNEHREGVALAISAQGVDANQYMRCVRSLLTFFRPGDILGFGGWCIIGKMPRVMMPVFRETCDLVLPFAAKEGIAAIHIWGVIYPPALSYLYHIANPLGIAVSTDSAGVSLNPVRGQWGYGTWRNNRYKRPSADLLGADRVKHVSLTRSWLASFADSLDYKRVTLYRDGSPDLQNVTFPSCAICGEPMPVKRSHAKTCSPRCRKALSRQINLAQ